LPPIALGEGIQEKEAGILLSNGAIEIALNQSFHWLGEKVNIFCWQDKESKLVHVIGDILAFVLFCLDNIPVGL